MDKTVLIGAVTSNRHECYLEKWLEMVNSLDYPHQLVLVDTTPNDTSYYEKLLKLGDEFGFSVLRYEWGDDKSAYEMLADTRNMLRDIFLEGKYDFFFGLDTDEFLPSEALKRLVEHDKDIVGYPSPIWKTKPGVFKDGGYVPCDNGGFKLNNYTWEELFDRILKEKTQLLKVHSVSIGACLYKRKVFEKVFWRFSEHPPFPEDMILFIEMEKAGFESYVDMGIIPLHLPVGWKDVPRYRDASQTGCLLAVHGFVTNDKPGTRPLVFNGPEPGADIAEGIQR
jgi:hypothetical protein